MNARRKEAPAPRGGKRAGRRAADPHYDREASRYAEPLPSREFILQVLDAEAVPVDERRLATLLGVKRRESEVFARRLGAMERDGQILRNRKGAICGAKSTPCGSVEVTRPAASAPDDGSDDLYPLADSWSCTETECSRSPPADLACDRPGSS
jgi:hypothetical protein